MLSMCHMSLVSNHTQSLYPMHTAIYNHYVQCTQPYTFPVSNGIHMQSLCLMAPSHTWYALVSNDSVIHHWSLLLRWEVSSAACITASFCLGMQLACPHSTSGQKALWGFGPNLTPTMYIPTDVVCSMYTTCSFQQATVMMELHRVRINFDFHPLSCDITLWHGVLDEFV